MRCTLLVVVAAAGCGQREAAREADPPPVRAEQPKAVPERPPWWWEKKEADPAPPEPTRKEAVADLIRSYYAAPIPARGKYVLDPAGYDDIAGWFYEGYRRPKKEAVKVLLIREGETPQHLLVTIEKTDDGKSDAAEIPVRKTARGYRIDWLAWVADPVTTKQFRQLRDEMDDILAENEAADGRWKALEAEAKRVGNDEAKGAKILAEVKALSAAGEARKKRVEQIAAETMPLAARLKVAQDRATAAYRPR